MSEQAITQIVAVLVGGLLAIAGGFVTTTLIDRQRRSREARNLAVAFKGEITALLTRISERKYHDRFAEVTRQIESSQQPFYMPVRVRLKYGRVYDSNVDKIGMLSGSLPELVPLFYTRLNSIKEQFAATWDEGRALTLEQAVDYALER